MAQETEKPIFRDLTADEPEPEISEIESLCMNCGDNGITRLLLTKIPFYKEVIVMSFDCEKCGFANNEIQSGGKIEEKGKRIVLRVDQQRDLNRQVVKSDFTCVKIPELDFEIPAQSQKGEITTTEGILDRSIVALEQDQPSRRLADADAADKIDAFIKKLKDLKDLRTTFTLIIEDITGNAFVENPNAPETDPKMELSMFKRTEEQNHSLGIYEEQKGEFTLEDLQGEVMQFPTNCPHCNCPCDTNMKVVNIPHFKDVVIMATNCEQCGHRTNEVKSGGGIEPKGLRIEVIVSSPKDFTRDVLKSETCSLSVPELEVEVGPAALGGRFTTVEGILVAIKEQLADKGHMFGDSATDEIRARFDNFISKIDCVLNVGKGITLILDDPAGNSYVQKLEDGGEEDPGLKVVHYERTFEHNEELGLNDMKTEGYEIEK